jgi:hypothetical protein
MSIDPSLILDRCCQAGLKVWRNGESIRIKPAKNCPPDLLQDIRDHKLQLLALLATSEGAPTEQPATHQSAVSGAELPSLEILRTWPTGKLASRPVQRSGTNVEWLHVAKQVAMGEFDNGDRGLLESLLLGVRNIPHPACQSAEARLQTLLSRRKETR